MQAAFLFPLLALWPVTAGAQPANVLPVRATYGSTGDYVSVQKLLLVE